MVEILSAIIGAMGSVAVVLINNLLQREKKETPSLLVPKDYVYHKPKSATSWKIISAMAILGAGIGYVFGSIVSSQKNTDVLPTPIPSPITSSSTCPVVTPFSEESKGKFIYVLIDNSGSYKNLQSNAFEVLVAALTRSITTKDHVLLSWINETGNSSNRIFFDQGVEVTNPTAIPTPQIIPSPTPFTISVGPTTLLVQATKTAQEIEDRNTENFNNYFCLQTEQNNQLQELRSQGISLFNSQIGTAIENATRQTNPSATTNIWQALYIASKTLQDIAGQEQYKSVKFLIFSDMVSVGEEPFTQLNFKNVDVIVPMLPCSTPQNCENVIHQWELTFNNANAKSITFKIQEQTNSEILAELITSP